MKMPQIKTTTAAIACTMCISAITIFVPNGTSHATDSEVKEGLWEFTTHMQMEGMEEMPKLPPGVQLPPGMSMSTQGNTMQVTVKQCITKENMVPQDKDMKEHNCKIINQEKRGNTVKWTAVCNEEDMKMTTEGTATYTGNVMESKMVINTQAKGEPPMKQIVTAKGKYLGPCPSK